MQFLNEQELDAAISVGDGASPVSSLEAIAVKADATLERDMSNQAHDAPTVDWSKINRVHEIGVYLNEGKKYHAIFE